MAKFAVILSGCGFKEGTEVSEAVLALLALSMNCAEYDLYAPDVDFDAINYINGEEEGKRSTLAESMRIAPRNIIKDLLALNSSDYDGLILPGGMGVKNILYNNEDVREDTIRIIKAFHNNKKPV